MSLGAWIFAAVVLVLVVVNAPFRKWFLRAAGVVVALAVVVGLGWYIYGTHEQHVAEAAQKVLEAQQQKQVDDCIKRQMKDAKDGNVIDETIARSVCTDNPDAPAGAAAPAPAVDYDAIAKKYGGRRAPKPAPERHVRAKVGVELTTTEYGSLKCGKVEAGEVLTLLADDSITIKVKTESGKIGWAAAYQFEVVQ